MALKIVTGGTTGAADGTLVSSGNPLVITALNTAIDAHIRCDDGYWSNDQAFDVPAELQVSFDGGTTWYGNADEPITAPEIYAVNYPIKVKQVTAAASTSGSFTTNGTYTAIAALSTPTLTATVVSDTQIDLSWTNVANEDASPGYTIERSLNGSTWSALTTKAANVTTHSDTGLATNTRYYYRVKAEGSGRYSDSGWGTDDDTTLALVISLRASKANGGTTNYAAAATTSPWTDVSGNSRNGTLTNGPIWRGAGTGGDPYCLEGDGTNDYVDLGNLAALDLSLGSYSLAFWIKTSMATDFVGVLDKADSSGSFRGYYIDLGASGSSSRGKPRLIHNAGASQSALTAASTINDGNWHHVMFTFDSAATTAKVYIDGALSGSAKTDMAVSVSASTETAKLFGDGGSTNYLAGRIASLRAFTNVLTATQVSAEYALGVTY